MSKADLASEFDRKATPPVLGAAAYFDLLEKLLTAGTGYGKTEPVAAYLLRDLRIVTEAEAADLATQVKITPVYVVMDPKEWPNEYGRSLVMQDIMVSYAKRMVGESELNAPDFKGPGLWTVKKRSFEEDYSRREGVTEEGRPANLYDPNPDAFRVCLQVTEPVTIPTNWGAPWTIGAGGTLAIREKDVEALAAALLSVKRGLATVEQALFGTGSVTRFDVYGMEPEFLENNYRPVALKDTTGAAMAAVRAARGKGAPAP
jgi:hypothetical protein